ncbi:hypothetical protein N781_17240 [Pontibacillus halophilus JSM 076056 = DSM 19796]|uniref:Spore germination protein n=1 Tax=Pontibacillus halophilus JSM 076056 = DSM 19796 TaxID=1385510 RepID=A0A0A5GKQ3_9BACI|nr:Ger(x)C family spore germination protein [Pontibacillus halophilus]KGX92529.1 hypothetical protein N781_17240 [Pontibacillus halophilus JSM 076056 = DSM 19796]
MRRLLLITFSLFLLSGCWDHQEVEELGIVTGVGIDQSQEDDEKLRVTNQYVIPSAVSTRPKGSSSGLSPFINETLEAGNVLDTIRDQSLYVGKPPYYYHLKVVVLSQELVEQESMLDLLFFFFRDHEIRRSVGLIVARDSAETLLSQSFLKDEVPSIQLEKISYNYLAKTARMAPSVTLGGASKDFAHKKSFVIQLGDVFEGKVRIEGGAVIDAQKAKMVATLSPEETEAYNWITEQSDAGVIQASTNGEEERFAYEIRDVTSKVKVRKESGQLTYDISVHFQGKLGEDYSPPSSSFQPEYINKREKALQETLKKRLVMAMERAQHEYEVDFYEFMEPFRIKYVKEWYKVKDNWNEVFSEATVNFDVQVEIDHFQDVGRKLPYNPPVEGD